MNLFLGFYPVSLIYISVFLPLPHCFDHCNLIEVKSGSLIPQFHFSFSGLLGYLETFVFLYKFEFFLF